MPYYCTVPRCTSMAGKAKDVSFHQFPKNEELARLWNKILKRGKPYTKYSKVCSLHFRPEDYTLNKTRGQWRTLRKDAIPSQNLPTFESPGPSSLKMSNGSWVPPPLPNNLADPQIQQQMAQAIYMQTMLAMQAASNGTPSLESQPEQNELTISPPPISELEKALLLQNNLPVNPARLQENVNSAQQIRQINENTSYKCEECLKCFKDPDVFMLHKRMHNKENKKEKENLNSNNENNKETLKSNPILAHLLSNGVAIHDTPSQGYNIFDVNNILSIENQIMAALAANMEGYIRLSKMLLVSKENQDCGSSSSNNENDNIDEENSDVNLNNEINTENNSNKSDIKVEIFLENENNDNDQKFGQENKLFHERHKLENDQDYSSNCVIKDQNNQNNKQINKIEDHEHENNKMTRIKDEPCQNEELCLNNDQNDHKVAEGLEELTKKPNCDNQDLNESKDSNKLVIDED